VQFLDDVKNHSPRDFVVFGANIRRSADALYGKDRELPQRQENQKRGIRVYWDRYPTVRRWFREFFPDPVPVIQATAATGSYPEHHLAEDLAFLEKRGPVKKRPKSLILYGASKLGKTDFARALGAYLHFRSTMNLKTFMNVGAENIDYVIWDDVPWSDEALKAERYKNWLGGQDFFTTTDRYLPKADIVWGKPGIYLSNFNPLQNLCKEDVSWIQANCIIVDLGDVADCRFSAICEADDY
jgi:hypothetical protein